MDLNTISEKVARRCLKLFYIKFLEIKLQNLSKSLRWNGRETIKSYAQRKNEKKLYDFFYNLYIIPISSRERESFSPRNFIGSPLISFLLIKTISSVMFICFIGPSLSQFNQKNFVDLNNRVWPLLSQFNPRKYFCT